MFKQCVAQRLCQAALDLPLHLLAVDGFAHVMHADDLQHLHLPGQRVDLHLHRLGGVAVGVVRLAVARQRVERGGGRGTELAGDPDMLVVGVAPRFYAYFATTLMNKLETNSRSGSDKTFNAVSESD